MTSASNRDYGLFPKWLGLFSDSLKPAEIVDINSLREWSLSQVFRLTLDDGRTLIAKRGIPTKGPTELEIYQDCLIPFSIDAPKIYESRTGDSEYIFLMEDLGGLDLERQSSSSNFFDAARKLADIRASTDIGDNFGASALQNYVLTIDQLLLDFDYVLEHAGSEYQEIINILRRTAKSFSKHADQLYKESPLTLNHNDYHRKNLLNVDGRIIPIDWANACISPHIGDLYCLIEEAKYQHISESEVVGAYRSALKDLGVQDEISSWHIDMGGLCWSIHCLQWILEYGLETIPISKDWVPDFLTYICSATSRLEIT